MAAAGWSSLLGPAGTTTSNRLEQPPQTGWNSHVAKPLRRQRGSQHASRTPVDVTQFSHTARAASGRLSRRFPTAERHRPVPTATPARRGDTSEPRSDDLFGPPGGSAGLLALTHRATTVLSHRARDFGRAGIQAAQRRGAYGPDRFPVRSAVEASVILQARVTSVGLLGPHSVGHSDKPITAPDGSEHAAHAVNLTSSRRIH